MPWYHEFFDELYLEQYRHLIPPERTTAEVGAIIDLLELGPGARILDLCCGHGRHAVELAARGFNVCGQDLTRMFLERAAEAATERGVSLDLRCGDMREIVHDPPFDAVIHMFTAFGYFDHDEEEAKVMREVARVLRPGGKYLLQTINRDGVMRKFLPKDWDGWDNGMRLLCERTFDPVSGRNRERRETIFPDGSRRVQELAVRLFTPTEIRRMMRDAGLEPVASYATLGGDELTIDSMHQVNIAVKP